MDPVARDERFRSVYAEHFDALLGYALRRSVRPEDAADVVAETFLVAWRRMDELPADHEARPWLYGVARRVLANQRRGAGRHTALGARLGRELAACVPDLADQVVDRQAAEARLAELPERDREVMELAVWEELAPREIAEVLGVSAVAVRTRLSLARSRLRLAPDPADASDHEPTLDIAHDPAGAPTGKPRTVQEDR